MSVLLPDAAGQVLPGERDQTGKQVEPERLHGPEEPGWAGIEEAVQPHQAQSENERSEEDDPCLPEVRDRHEDISEGRGRESRVLAGESPALVVPAVGDD